MEKVEYLCKTKMQKKVIRQLFEESIHEGKAGGAERSGKGICYWGWCVHKKEGVDP